MYREREKLENNGTKGFEAKRGSDDSSFWYQPDYNTTTLQQHPVLRTAVSR
jgi:hypothetical protein